MAKILPNLTLNLRNMSAGEALKAIAEFTAKNALLEQQAADDAAEREEQRKPLLEAMETAKAAYDTAVKALADFDGKPVAKTRTRVANGERATRHEAAMTAARAGVRPQWEPAPESNASRNSAAAKYDAVLASDMSWEAKLGGMRAMKSIVGTDTYGVRLENYRLELLAYCEAMANPPTNNNGDGAVLAPAANNNGDSAVLAPAAE